jgi:hypothetical protein
MTTPLSSVSATVTAGVNLAGGLTQAGLPNPAGNAVNEQANYAYKSSILNSAAFGTDQLYYLLNSIAASGNLTIDLSNYADISGRTGASLIGGRLKWWRFRVLATAETAPDGTAGTACSSVTFGNAAGTGTNGWFGPLTNATATYAINGGSTWQHGDGTAAGYVVDATHKLLYFVNNDAANVAKLLVAFGGCTS